MSLSEALICKKMLADKILTSYTLYFVLSEQKAVKLMFPNAVWND